MDSQYLVWSISIAQLRKSCTAKATDARIYKVLDVTGMNILHILWLKIKCSNMVVIRQCLFADQIDVGKKHDFSKQQICRSKQQQNNSSAETAI